ncbi:MAG: Snf7 family protein [Nitrosopumilus sp.]|nr:Snf7 family protein [Nitrosopumilus sp.]MDH3489424.1 Snf7 family protein [Nitrosopumilus sp.]MDH3516419.1 Snf7 family protein [Nitrosopumilus sp.]MDH3565385.1 Snf7 family protein [Nitrosopumilus sp.]MDH5417370.1 Snf7 family protein [Nitrosopumilus sp.]
MANFGQSWNRPPSNGLGDKISGMFKQEAPLKPRIDNAIRGLNKPISKLDNTSNQLNQKDDKLFQRIIQAQQNKDIRTSKILANELAQIRKTNKMIGNMRTAVDRTQLRLSTVSTMGDAIVSMQPAVNTMKAVGPAMNKIIPQASQELESMGNMLGDMMPGSIGDDYYFANSGSSQETDAILSEAAAVAETQIGNKFPSVPLNATQSSYSTKF